MVWSFGYVKCSVAISCTSAQTEQDFRPPLTDSFISNDCERTAMIMDRLVDAQLI